MNITNIKSYIVLDLETTGINSKKDKIISIGMLKIIDAKIIEEYYKLINPGVEIKNSNKHNITDEMVKDKPKIEELRSEIIRFINNNIIVGHNLKSFDRPFLKNSIEYWIEDEKVYDTWHLAQKILPELENHKLSYLCEKYLNLDTSKLHNAIYDCKVTYKLFEKLKLEKIPDSKKQDLSKQCLDPKFKNILNGKKIVFTGKFEKTRALIESEASQYGAKVTKTPSKKTDFLIYGSDSGSKLSKAKILKIDILSEEKYYQYLEKLKIIIKQKNINKF